MMKIFPAGLITTAAIGLTAVDGTTNVAVIELGKRGTIRRTAGLEETSVDGVESFWSALHGHGKKLQLSGMTVVPDLFSHPDSGVVIGLTGTGIELDRMPNLNGLLSNEGERVVGQMTLGGNQCKKMLNNVNHNQQWENASVDNLRGVFESHAKVAGISGMHVVVTSSNAASIDEQIAALLSDYASKLNGRKTVVVHLVVEEDEGSARRRALARRLDFHQDSTAHREDEITSKRRRLEEGVAEGDANGGQANANNGFYGYGYYNAYGEWVTPYKTMFQIQYLNVVLWTSLGLVAVLFFSIYLMIYMPLMADTLLFGESARVAHDN